MVEPKTALVAATGEAEPESARSKPASPAEETPDQQQSAAAAETEDKEAKATAEPKNRQPKTDSQLDAKETTASPKEDSDLKGSEPVTVKEETTPQQVAPPPDEKETSAHSDEFSKKDDISSTNENTGSVSANQGGCQSTNQSSDNKPASLMCPVKTDDVTEKRDSSSSASPVNEKCDAKTKVPQQEFSKKQKSDKSKTSNTTRKPSEWKSSSSAEFSVDGDSNKLSTQQNAAKSPAENQVKQSSKRSASPQHPVNAKPSKSSAVSQTDSAKHSDATSSKKSRCSDLKSQVDGPSDFLDLSFTSSDSSDHEGVCSSNSSSGLGLLEQPRRANNNHAAFLEDNNNKPRTRSQWILRSGSNMADKDAMRVKRAQKSEGVASAPTPTREHGRDNPALKRKSPSSCSQTTEEPKTPNKTQTILPITTIPSRTKNTNSIVKNSSFTNKKHGALQNAAGTGKRKQDKITGSGNHVLSNMAGKEQKRQRSAPGKTDVAKKQSSAVGKRVHSTKVTDAKVPSAQHDPVSKETDKKQTTQERDSDVIKENGVQISGSSEGEQQDKDAEAAPDSDATEDASGLDECCDNCDDCETDEEAEEGVVHKMLPRCPWYTRCLQGGVSPRSSYSAPNSPAAALLPAHTPLPPTPAQDDLVLTRHARRQLLKKQRKLEQQKLKPDTCVRHVVATSSSASGAPKTRAHASCVPAGNRKSQRGKTVCRVKLEDISRTPGLRHEKYVKTRRKLAELKKK